ncbi:hypothetical protein SKAU_G00107870 [Synaphobranchus kaupii]|uniref:Sodium-dependent lysophosphatidylcholine symporter 1-like n=1 Tax=Synaphobranchus kaupii TaxID=118154 RepID=A0A9Q1J7S2_SYNKA|nr:hypothetical protein SKAU_G00107870 [Synaphobranchus kaupii]
MAETSTDTLVAHMPPESTRRAAEDKDKGIPLSRKLCYAVGGAPYQMTAVTKGFFMQIFLLDVVQMSGFYVSVILFMGRAWDAITDPLVGYFVAKSDRTRIGKLIPWLVFSTPFGVLSYVMMWFTPQDTMSPTLSFSWYFIMCCLFDTFMRMGMELFGSLVGAVIQGQIVGVYHAKRAQACSQLNHTEHVLQNLSSPLSDTLHNTRRAYLIAAVILGALYFLCCLVLFLGVKEQLAPLSTLDRIHMPYLRGVRMVVKHSPYVWLVFGFLFSSLAFQMAQGNFALFCTHAAGMGANFQHLVLILLTSATLSVPLWQILLVRLGKKTTLFLGLSVYAPTLAIISFVQSNLPVFIFMSALAGSSLASLYLLPWSMLPDVVDDFKVKNPTSKDLEPIFYSCYVFFNKFGGGISIGISTMALHFAGYKPGACSHNSTVITTLRVLFAPVPIALLLVGMVLFCFYPINETRRQQIQRELREAVTGEDDFAVRDTSI